MSISRYFIERPIFAWVLAILVCLFGLLSIRSLPIAQFPALAPPQISVTAIYPGADATTLDKTTTQIIEQQLQGIDHLRYFSSQSSSSGTVAVTLTFEQGTDPDTAQVQVNNKVQAALPLLPQEVQRQGVRVEKSSANFALVPGPLFGRQFARPVRSCGHDGVQDPGAGQPHQRRRRLPAVRLAICDADLGRSDEAQQLPADHGRRDVGGAGAECAGLRGPARQPSRARHPAAQRHRFRPVAAADSRAIRGNPAQDVGRRLGRSAARRGPRRARVRRLWVQREI